MISCVDGFPGKWKMLTFMCSIKSTSTEMTIVKFTPFNRYFYSTRYVLLLYVRRDTIMKNTPLCLNLQYITEDVTDRLVNEMKYDATA